MPDDKEFRTYSFEIKEFCQICGIDDDNGGNYSNLKKATKTLRDKSIWVQLENGSETTLSWIDQVTINKNNGVIELKISDMMKPYLLQLQEKFTQYTLYHVLAMRSRYSVRLYEILKSYEFMHGCEFTIDEFKKMMDAQHYKQHIDVRRNVLDIAEREINAFSDITISYTLAKTGRRFTKIKFYIKAKKDMDERMGTWKKIEERLEPKQVRK